MLSSWLIDIYGIKLILGLILQNLVYTKEMKLIVYRHKYGATGEIWTRDLLITNEVLYP